MRKFLQTMTAACMLLGAAGGGFALVAWADGKAPAPAAGQVRVIEISARRFVFTPGTIRIRKGETVEFRLTTADVLMGFSVPDYNIRTDIPPGQVARLRFTADKAGTFVFLCDVFCGSGHETMNGTITVSG